MIKDEKMYLMYCNELGLEPNKADNLKKFVEDEDVYFGIDNELMFIDALNEMEYYDNDLYYHNSFSVPLGSIKDSLVDVPLYKKLEYDRSITHKKVGDIRAKIEKLEQEILTLRKTLNPNILREIVSHKESPFYYEITEFKNELLIFAGINNGVSITITKEGLVKEEW